MRKYPAGGVAAFRSPVKGAGDVVLGGGKLVIPQGAVIHTPIAAIQLSPDLWDEPERFNPDRWLQVCMHLNTLSVVESRVQIRMACRPVEGCRAAIVP